MSFTVVTLVRGNSSSARESAIAADLAQLAADESSALILEGLPDGLSSLLASATVSIARIAPGCPCCIGNLTMRVTLNRILRHPPNRLYISLAPNAHLETLRDFLSHAPYDGLLQIASDIHV